MTWIRNYVLLMHTAIRTCENSENIIDTLELFTDDFFAYLCQETNRYHDEQEHNKYTILKRGSTL